MWKAFYWQRGETLDYVNNGTETIESGSIIVLGSRLGVAGEDIAPGTKGSLHVEGIFEMQKGSGEIAAGDEVYYAGTDGLVTAVAAGAPAEEPEDVQAVTIKAGFAAEKAASSDTTVLVKINA